AASRSAADREMRCRSVLFRDQLLADSDEIAPSVRLVLELPGLMPLAAVFSTAAHICVADDRTLIDERERTTCKGGHVARHAVRAISLNEKRVSAVELEAPLIDQ